MSDSRHVQFENSNANLIFTNTHVQVSTLSCVYSAFSNWKLQGWEWNNSINANYLYELKRDRVLSGFPDADSWLIEYLKNK